MMLNWVRAAQLASLVTQKLCDQARRRVTSTQCQRHVIVEDLKLVTRCHVVGGGQSGAKKLMSFHRWSLGYLVWW